MTRQPTIELATPADAASIARMSRELIEHGLSWRWREQRVADAIADPDTNAVVIKQDHTLVAFGIMEFADEDAHLVLFAVRAADQRQGIGSALLAWLEASARAAGVQRVRVEARRENVAARSFYNEHGYHERIIKQGMYDARVDGVVWKSGCAPPPARPNPSLERTPTGRAPWPRSG